MTVVDSSCVVDYLVGSRRALGVRTLLAEGEGLAAPDLLVFEIVSAMRRGLARGDLTEPRARAAVDDLGDFAVDLFPSLALRGRAWELRDNLTASDALFAALAEELGVPLATSDRRLARAAREQLGLEVIELG